MNSKCLIFSILIALAGSALARPYGPCRPGPYRPCPPPSYHHYHNNSWWGRGGCNFWPSFVGGMTGAMLGTAIANRNSTIVERQTAVATPVVVTTPIVVQPAVVTAPPAIVRPTQVWIDGHYVNQTQANGTVIRVWQPGHYEYR